MPQESAGRTTPRTPALALLVGLVLTLLAHVITCAVHAHAGEDHAHAAASVTYAETGAWVREAVDCVAGHDADSPGRPGHGDLCCDPADRTADVRTPGTALLLALLLMAAVLLRDSNPVTTGPSSGRQRATGVPRPPGPPLLRLVCVSRT